MSNVNVPDLMTTRSKMASFRNELAGKSMDAGMMKKISNTRNRDSKSSMMELTLPKLVFDH